jgi:hypothetical protein
MDGTGFLTPDDLAEFDQAVHEFLNGEYYQCPATNKEIVDSITELRDRRETEMYMQILETFGQVKFIFRAMLLLLRIAITVSIIRILFAFFISTSSKSAHTCPHLIEFAKSTSPFATRCPPFFLFFSNVQVMKDISKAKDKKYLGTNLAQATRPWGQRGEDCNVWVVSLNGLLKTVPPIKILPEGRESVFDMVKAALPPMAFPFTVDLLKDSLRLYQSPFGQVANTEQVSNLIVFCLLSYLILTIARLHHAFSTIATSHRLLMRFPFSSYRPAP